MCRSIVTMVILSYAALVRVSVVFCHVYKQCIALNRISMEKALNTDGIVLLYQFIR